MTRIVISGGSGFLGRHVGAALGALDAELALLMRDSSVAPDPALFRRPPVLLRARGNADAADQVRRFVPDIVVHTACNYGRNGESLGALLEANYMFGWALFETSVGAGATLFINCDTVLPPDLNPYAFTKAQFVDLVRFSRKRGVCAAGAFVNLKLQTMYGPGDQATKFSTAVARHMVENAAPLKMTPGTQRRDFIHISDVALAIKAIVERRDLLAEWEDIPVGSGDAYSVRTFVETMARLSGFQQELQPVLPMRPGEPDEMKADTGRLRSLGWAPKTDFETGILSLIEDARQSKAAA